MTTSNRHTVRITSTGLGGSLSIDGQDISGSVLGLDLHMDACSAPQLFLDMAAYPLSTEISDAEIYLKPEARQLLVQLGWTPPEEGAPDVMD